MPNIKERFQQWRGAQAGNESKYLLTAELIKEYVDRKITIEDIKRELNRSVLATYQNFDRFNGRALGAIVLFKLTIDEVRDALPEEEKNKPLSAILDNLSEGFATAYSKTPTTLTINIILENIQSLLSLDKADFSCLSREQTKNLLFTVYTLLSIANISLHLMNGLVAALASKIVNIERIKKLLQTSLKQLYEKAKQLEPVQEQRDSASILLQNYFQQLYLRQLTENEVSPQSLAELNILQKLMQLDGVMENITVHLARLIELKKNQEQLQSKRQAMNQFLEIIQQNEQQISQRKYFAELIDANNPLFQLLIDSTQDELKDKLLSQMVRLSQAVEAQELSIRMTRMLSYYAAPVIESYRSFMPQTTQDLITTYTPATFDSECKNLLKELATNYLTEIEKKRINLQLEVEEISSKLVGKNRDLHQLIVTERVDAFIPLNRIHAQTQSAFRDYCSLLRTVKENMDFISQYQEDAASLKNFRETHHGFLVRLSNFFAHFSSAFKTKTAKLLDEVSACKQKVDQLISDYRDMVNLQLQQIENDPRVARQIKAQLKKRFIDEVHAINHGRLKYPVVNTIDIRLLVNRLSELFAQSPKPKIAQDFANNAQIEPVAEQFFPQCR